MIKKFQSIFSIMCVFFIVKGQHREVVPYIDFLQKQQVHSVDYIFQLFEKYDIVILGERDHRDILQYELIEKIISDNRFIENVGNIFTEVGMYNRTEWANRILKNQYRSYADFENELRLLYRELDYDMIWDKYNFWAFLSSIYRINTRLQPSQKINLFFTDVSFDWNSCLSREDWITLAPIYNGFYRDSIMGSNMISAYNNILKNEKETRKKALVIFNRPHSYQFYIDDDNKNIRSAASYIFEKFAERVANVMINWWSPQKNGEDRLIASGKWDAAFLSLNNPQLGFDFIDSPFGVDKFDHYSIRPLENVKYQDVYTGFVFYGGITSWNFVIGIPGIIDDEFGAEYLRRYKIFKPDIKTSLDEESSYYNTVRSNNAFGGDNKMKKRIEKKINYWLKE